MEFLPAIGAYFVRYGYFVVFVGVMLENVGMPLPGEAILLAAGFFAYQGHFALPVVMGVAAMGAILGDNAGYGVGRRLGRPFLERYGRYVLLSPARLTAIETFFARHGAKTILMARFVSGLRVVAAFGAGMSHMPWQTFFLYNTTGAVLWAVTISLLGYVFGHSWEVLHRWMGRVGLFAVAAVGIGCLCLALLRQARKLRTAVHVHLPKALSFRELAIIALILTAVAFFSKITEDVVTHESVRFDTITLKTLHHAIPSNLNALVVGVTILGSVPIMLLAVLACGGFLLSRRATRPLMALTGVTLLTVALHLLLTAVFHRQRPPLWEGPFSLTDYAFPSGHSMEATAVYGMMAYLLG